MLTSFKIFSRLRGEWSFSRQIINAKDPACSGVVTGSASFTPIDGSEDELLYEEQGVFVTADQKECPIRKDYIYAYNQATDKVEKYFAENKQKKALFYVFGETKHMCAEDCYVPKYAFPEDEHFNRFSLTYEVVGPKKSYTTSTNFFKNSL